MRLLGVIVLGSVLGGGVAAAGTCDAVMNGQLKGLTVPMRTVNTNEVAGSTTSFENIVANGIIYSHMKDGSWKSEKQSANEASIRKNWTDNDKCQPAGTEAVDGEMADVVIEHTAVGQITLDTQFWISQKSGQIIKSRLAGPGTSLTSRFYFDNVQVPSGVGTAKH